RSDHFLRCLVCLQLQDRLVGLDGCTVWLEPAADGPLGDRFAHGRHLDFHGHAYFLAAAADRSSSALPLASTTPRRASAVARTTWGAGAWKALSTISCCSRLCTWIEPVAGLALASRPMYSTGKPMLLSRGSMKLQAPLFCDSSWTHTNSRALR